jgi:hypothetical protein
VFQPNFTLKTYGVYQVKLVSQKLLNKIRS